MTDTELVAELNRRLDELLPQVGQCACSEDELGELLWTHIRLAVLLPEEDYAPLTGRVAVAVNSYCHILSLACGLKDEAVDLQTASRLKARADSHEGLTDEEVRLLGKRGIDHNADEELHRAFLAVVNVIQGKPVPQKTESVRVVPVEYYTTLSDEQFEILGKSLFDQAVVCSSVFLTDKAFYGKEAAESTSAQARFELAYLLAQHNGQYACISPLPHLTPAQRKAEADYIEDICRRAKLPDGISPDERDFLFRHRPSSLALLHKMCAAFWSGCTT